ncbi:helix-turn-helix domain-containing protein [Afipia massiliensis]|uniref:Helix-turn-helix domain-containing protein n=1 Tax=Afipia massiliensis TaxID=211460 RepID=A0A4U6BQV3_9BRAD|nr:AraC family transcriptional regulator [Afipia massiliensis]TKT72291.1 helix-turn-helix domain-containing protein [Afipia massiliensis]
MTNLFNLIVDDYRILDSENRPVEDTFSQSMIWLDNPGCVLQPGNFQLPGDLRTHGIMKPGLYMTIVLEGTGESCTNDGPERVRYSENQLLGMAIREPTPCSGEAPRGPIRAVGIAFPRTSITALGLEQEFVDLFRTAERPVLVFSVQAPPRIQAIAAEILSPTLDGPAGKLLMSAQATEVLARGMHALRRNAELGTPVDNKRARLQVAKDMMDADLRYPWSIAELAHRAGTSRRSFNLRFRAAYGVSAIDYLRTRRLEIAREALVYQNMTVTEAADLVGYTNPANFATAFRKHFGSVPSLYRSQTLS